MTRPITPTRVMQTLVIWLVVYCTFYDLNCSLHFWTQAQLELQELHTSTQMLQRPTILPQRRPSNYNSLAKSMSTPTRTTWHKTLSSSTKNLLLLVQRTGIAKEWSLGSWLEHFFYSNIFLGTPVPTVASVKRNINQVRFGHLWWHCLPLITVVNQSNPNFTERLLDV